MLPLEDCISFNLIGKRATYSLVRLNETQNVVADSSIETTTSTHGLNLAENPPSSGQPPPKESTSYIPTSSACLCFRICIQHGSQITDSAINASE